MSIAKKTAIGAGWSIIDNIASQLSTLLIGIVLARILSPSDYGAVGALSIFITLANVIVESGLGPAIIRKVDRTEADLSTAFAINVALGVVVYAALFAASPVVAHFFRMPSLEYILKVLGLLVVINSLGVVQTALLIAELNIKKYATINVIAQILSGCGAIAAAGQGHGAWSLVLQQLFASAIRVFLLWVLSSWRPKFRMCRNSMGYLLRFGWKLLASGMVGSFFDEIYSVLIGRYIGAHELGLYANSRSLASKPRDIVANIVNRVALPMMTNVRKEDIHKSYLKILEMICFVSLPLMMLFAGVARPLIHFLLSEKWADAVILVQILSVGLAWSPLGQVALSLFQLLGRTDVTLKLEGIKKPLCILMILAGSPFGLLGIVASASLYNLVGASVNLVAAAKLLQIPASSIFLSVYKYFVAAAVGAGCAGLASNSINNDIISVAVGAGCGVVSYAGLCVILRCPAVRNTMLLINTFRRGRT